MIHYEFLLIAYGLSSTCMSLALSNTHIYDLVIVHIVLLYFIAFNISLIDTYVIVAILIYHAFSEFLAAKNKHKKKLICYERFFNEFYPSIWNQLVFNHRLQLFVQSPQPYLLIFCLKKLNVFSQHIGKKQMNIWIPQNKSPGIEILINFLC